MARMAFVFGCLLWVIGSVPGRALDSATDYSIRAATFEFLAPGKDSRSKGLIGTAFAIGPNEFVTAAHLLDSAIGSRFERPVLIDSGRVVYQIGDVLHYSEQKDYVIFSLRRAPRIRPLVIQRNEPTSSELYIAGAKSGGSVAIEPGTLVGLTPDEESAGFDWLRFTGPTWGAAGGGPILDKSGQVMGIVLAGSTKGGANYAIPIRLVASETPNRAQLRGMEMLRSLMPAVSSTQPLQAEIPLPMSFDNFTREVQQLRRAYFDQTVGPLLEAARGKFLLTGDAAADTCNLLNGGSCQCKARAGASGVLAVEDSRADKSKQLRVNAGDAVSQMIAGAGLVRTRGPTDSSKPSPDPVSNAAVHLKLALQGPTRADLHFDASTNMPFGTAKGDDRVYIDFRDRTWHMRTWALLDRDLEVLSMTRKVDDGYVVLTRIVPTALEYAADLQLKFYANLIYNECEQFSEEGVAQVADTMRR